MCYIPLLTVFAYLLNIVGLSFDIYGVVKLFYITDREKGLGKINITDKVLLKSPVIPDEMDSLETRILNNIPWYKNPDAIDFFNRLNGNIEETNRYNSELKVSSRKWLQYIIMGFLMSCLSIVLQMACFLCYPNT